MLLSLLFTALTLHAAPKPRALPITANNIRFVYASQDGEIRVPCTHKFLPHSYDWFVKCGAKTYTAHVVVSVYSRPQPPKQSYEILYWITDHQSPPGKPGQFVGSTSWIKLMEPSAIHSLDVSQEIENTAYLGLEIDLR